MEIQLRGLLKMPQRGFLSITLYKEREVATGWEQPQFPQCGARIILHYNPEFHVKIRNTLNNFGGFMYKRYYVLDFLMMLWNGEIF